MKCTFIFGISVVMLVSANVFSDLNIAAKKEKFDASKMIMQSFSFDDAFLNAINVEREIANLSFNSKDKKQTAGVVYLIYGTICESYPNASDQNIIRFKGKKISKDVIEKSKPYLMHVITEKLDTHVKSMAIFSLGRAFVEDHDLVLWLYKQSKNQDLSLGERAQIIQSIIVSSGNKYKYIGKIAFKEWLYSQNLKKQKKAIRIALLEKGDKEQYLSDLMTLYLSSNTTTFLRKKINNVLMLYTRDQINPFKQLIGQCNKENQDKCFDEILSWLNK